jgi:phosphoribosylamine---glycine ligase
MSSSSDWKIGGSWRLRLTVGGQEERRKDFQIVTRRNQTRSGTASAMVFGVGAFTQGMMRVLRDAGASMSGYLTRPYGHYGPSMEGKVYDAAAHPSPVDILKGTNPVFVVPMSIEWALQAWAEEFVEMGVPLVCPVGEGLLLERDRDFARQLCRKYRIAFPESHAARDRADARAWVGQRKRGYVLKNPLCSPFSPLHTVVCESAAETLLWLERVDDSEGVFLQEYLGSAEAGHIALVSGGEVYSLVTNQEYKRAYAGDLGIVAGAPLGGLVERDPEDRYGLARELIHPLRPWFRRVGFNGPVQVTAMRHRGRWHVLEYNVRLGVTSGPLILRMLSNPIEVLQGTALKQPIRPRFRSGMRYGCSVTLAGYGYPYVSLSGPRLPVTVEGRLTCDVWWNEVAAEAGGGLVMTGHRIADVTAVAGTLEAALRRVYANIRRIHCAGSYYRLDIGRSLWPPGKSK